MINTMDGDGLKTQLREYFAEDARLQTLQTQVDEIKERQGKAQERIHHYMRQQGVDEINVNNVRFSRVLRGPKKAKVKDNVLQGILMRHLGGEDGKVRGVLEDLAKARTADSEATEPTEVLVKRLLKKAGGAAP